MHQPIELGNLIELSGSTREEHRLRLIDKGKRKFPNPYKLEIHDDVKVIRTAVEIVETAVETVG